jgi:hypothetical protein
LTDIPPEGPKWSLDDVDDDALLARLKRLPGFADLFAAPQAPAPAPAKGPDDGVMHKILGALEKLDKSPEPSPAPPPTPPQAAEPVLSKIASWFWDE